MSPWLILHVLAAGLWLGCIAVEVAFERMIPKTDGSRRLVAVLHERVDLAIEVPAFLLVLVSGAVLLAGAPSSGVLQVKLAAGSAAILANVYCVWLVIKRHWVAADAAEFERADARQHKVGALVVLLVLVTLALAFVHGGS